MKKKPPRLFIDDSAQPRTRLDLFLRSRAIRPIDFAREAGQSRQHLLRTRNGNLEPSRRKIAAMVSAARRLTLEAVAPDDLFELVAEEGGVWTSSEARKRAIAAARRTAKQGKLASDLLASIQKHPISTWAEHIRARKPAFVETIVRRLINVAYRELERSAAHAQAMLEVARDLTNDMNTTTPELLVSFRGRTFLYESHALLQMGNYIEALAALDEAEREYEGTPFCTNELAQTWYQRAAIHFKSGQLGEAARLADRAVSIFSVLGDTRRAAKARIISAGIRYERGDISAAREQWSLVIAPLQLAEDFEAVACVSLNLGSAETLLGNPAAAKDWLQRALKMFTRSGNRGEAIRARWSMAKLTLFHEDHAEGLRLLRNVRAEFVAADMPAEAGFVALDLVEQLFAAVGSMDEVFALCRSAITAFQDAGATPKMVEALVYLREATRRRTIDAELVREVKGYLEQAVQGRSVEFTPRPT